ncbi:putative phage abortive infection protein [Rhizobium leguminosarum]
MQKEIRSKPSADPPKPYLVVGAFIAVAALWSLNWVYGIYLGASAQGPFGDTFGAVNALFSGLAFVAVIHAILMQRYEIALAKEDAATTKAILDDQSSHLETQIANERRRGFEDTFFKMLSLFNDITDSVPFEERRSGSTTIHRGRYAIQMIVSDVMPRSLYVEHKLENYPERSAKFLENHQWALSHYFRNLESLFTFLNVSEGIDREFYAAIIRGHMSDGEQGILFHFGLTTSGERIKTLAERYSLFVDMRDEYAVFPELRSRYADSAFLRPHPLV